jgi:hypothetical protein
MTIGIAIPTFSGHVGFLKNLLYQISNSTVLPKQVSVSLSSFDGELELDTYPFDLIITKTKDFKNSSQNRNIAASKLETDIISFIDGDDLPHKKRNEFLLKSFENGSQIVLHNYERDNSYVVDYNQEINELDLYKDYIDTFVANESYPISSKGHLPYHNGHISILKTLFDKFKYDERDDLFGCCEDSEYNSRLVKNGYKICYIGNKLSYYYK